MSNIEPPVLEATSTPRRVTIFLLVLWLVTFAGLVVVAWKAYLDEKDTSLTLAQQVDEACTQGDLNSELTPELEEQLCQNALEVIEENDPELQDSEIQEPEIQEPELQESEIQDPEDQNSENQEPEAQDAEEQESEQQDSEIQDEEIQDGDPNDPDPVDDPDPNDPDPDDPDPDDPDPASPYDFTFTFTVPGSNPADPDRTYQVSCNSGTGVCTVQLVGGP